jgi:hypothetical protein
LPWRRSAQCCGRCRRRVQPRATNPSDPELSPARLRPGVQAEHERARCRLVLVDPLFAESLRLAGQ